MSHFIISCRSSYTSGTPKGQASTQFPHAMQRGFSADCTTPSPVRLIASAGHTSAQVGCSQCMQTTGTVCTLCDLSTNSRWIIDSPRCVSHSVHACTQAWHPIQRFGSMKNWRYSGFGMVLLLRLEDRSVWRDAVGLSHAGAAHFVLRDLADRILCRDGQSVCALVSRPVVGDEDRVRTNRRHDHGTQGDRAAARFDGGPVAVVDAELHGEPRMHFDPRLGVLIDQRTDPA